MITPDEIAALKLVADQLVKAVKMDNTVVLECEKVFSDHYVPKFRWLPDGPLYLSWEPYSSPTDFKLLYVDEGADEKGPMTNANEAQRTKYKHLLECMSFIANILNTSLA